MGLCATYTRRQPSGLGRGRAPVPPQVASRPALLAGADGRGSEPELCERVAQARDPHMGEDLERVFPTSDACRDGRSGAAAVDRLRSDERARWSARILLPEPELVPSASRAAARSDA